MDLIINLTALISKEPKLPMIFELSNSNDGGVGSGFGGGYLARNGNELQLGADLVTPSSFTNVFYGLTSVLILVLFLSFCFVVFSLICYCSCNLLVLI